MQGAYARSCASFRDQRLRAMEPTRSEESQNSRGRVVAIGAAASSGPKTHASQHRPSGRHQPSASGKKSSMKTTTTAGGRSAGGPTGRHPNAPSVRRQQQQRAAEAQGAWSQAKKPPPLPPQAWNAAVGTANAAAAAAGSTITVPLTINLAMTQGETSQLTNVSSHFGGDDEGSAAGGTGVKENAAPPFDPHGPGASQSSALMNVPLGQASISSRSQDTRPFLLRALDPLTKFPGAGEPSECIRVRFEEAEARRKIKAKEGARLKAMEDHSHLAIVKFDKAVREAAAREAAAREAEVAVREAASASSGAMGRLHIEPRSRFPGWEAWNDDPSVASSHPAAQPPAVPGTDAAAPEPPGDDLELDIDQARAHFAEERDKATDELNAATSRAMAALEERVAEARRAQGTLAQEHEQEAQRLLDHVRDMSRALRHDRRDLKEAMGEVKKLLDDARTTSHELRQDLVEEHAKASASLKDQLDRGVMTIRNKFRDKLAEIKRELFKDIVPFAEKYCGRWLEMFRQQEKEREKDKPRHSSSAAPVLVQPTASDKKRAHFSSTCTPPHSAVSNIRSHSPAPIVHEKPVKRTERGSTERDKVGEGTPPDSGIKAGSHSPALRAHGQPVKRTERGSKERAKVSEGTTTDGGIKAGSHSPALRVHGQPVKRTERGSKERAKVSEGSTTDGGIKAGSHSPALRAHGQPVKRTERGSKERAKVGEGMPTGSEIKALSSSSRMASTASNQKNVGSSTKTVSSRTLTPIGRDAKLVLNTTTSSKESATKKSAVATDVQMQKSRYKAIPMAPAKRRPPVKRPRAAAEGSLLPPRKKSAHLRPKDSLDFPSAEESSVA